MIELFFALFMAFACPAHHQVKENKNNTPIMMLDTGGEGEHVPPIGPPPPPPHG